MARIGFGSGLILELLAVLALWNRRWALIVGLALIALHRSIAALMNPQNERVVAVFLVNAPFWLWCALRSTSRRVLGRE